MSQSESMKSSNDDFNEIVKESLIKCITTNRPDVLKTILTSKSDTIDYQRDINKIRTNDGGTLLHLACQNGSLDIVRILLQAHLDPTVKDNAGKLAYEHAKNVLISQAFIEDTIQAICTNNLSRLQQMLNSGIDVNSVDSSLTKNTLLHWAAAHGSLDSVLILLDRSALVNPVNHVGITPLHEAVLRSDLPIVEELVNSGADHSIRATSGKHKDKTALDLSPSPTLSALMEHPGDYILKRSDSEESSPRPASPDSTCNKYEPLSQNGFAASSPKKKVTFNDVDKSTRLSLLQSDINLLNSLWPPVVKYDLVRSTRERMYLPSNLIVHMYITQDSEKSCAEQILSNLCDDLSALDSLTAESRVFMQGTLGMTCSISLELNPSVVKGRSDAYVIIIGRNTIYVRANSSQGLHNACQTVCQLIHLYCGSKHGLPLIKIVDWPSVTDRGVLIDLSGELHLKTEVIIDWIVSWSRMKANQIHFFYRYSHQRNNNIPAKRYYSLQSLRRLIDLCQQRQLSPVLALDIDQQVVSLDELQENTFISELIACFPVNSRLHLGPRIVAHLYSAASRSSPTLHLSDLPACLQRTSQHLLICAGPFRTKVVCTDNDGVEDREYELTIAHHPSLPILMEYLLRMNEYQHRHQLACYDDFSIPYWLCLSTVNWTGLGCPSSISGCFTRHVELTRDFLTKLANSSSSVCGLLSCSWSSSGSSLCHAWFSLPLHAFHLAAAWNPVPLIKCDESELKVQMCSVLNRFILKETIGDNVMSFSQLESQLLFCKSDVALSRLISISSDLNSRIIFDMSQSQTLSLFNKTRVQLKLLRELPVSPASRLLIFYLTYTQYVCRIIHLTKKFPTEIANDDPHSMKDKEYSLHMALKTDIANRLLSLIEDSRSIWQDWYEQEPSIDRSMEQLKQLVSLLLPNSKASVIMA